MISPGFTSVPARPHPAETTLTVHLSGDIDLYVCTQLERSLEPLVDASDAIIDVADVRYAGTTLLTALIRLVKARRAHGNALPPHLLGATESIRRILDLTNVSQLVQFQ
jgi:anti-anti-sigma factor